MKKYWHLPTMIGLACLLSGCFGAHLIVPHTEESADKKPFLCPDQSTYLKQRGEPHQKITIDGKPAWVF